MSTLHLTLHRRWFNDILDGTKTTEFRAKTPHWVARLEHRRGDYDRVLFRNGYGRQSPVMALECRGIVDGEWRGAPAYHIRLGRLLFVANWQRSQ